MMSFGIRGIPTFIGFLNGQKYKEFSGAQEQMLNATITELKSKIPMGKAKGAKGHDQLAFK